MGDGIQVFTTHVARAPMRNKSSPVPRLSPKDTGPEGALRLGSEWQGHLRDSRQSLLFQPAQT